VTNLFQSFLQGGTHEFSEIRSALDVDVAEEKGFITILKEHHDYIEESIKVLMSKDAPDEDKQNHTLRFFRLVQMHGKAEQETLYASLIESSSADARLEGFGGQDEHDLAFQLENELKMMGYETQWNEEIAAKARVAASLVQNHISEEESEMFAVAREKLSDVSFERMRTEYVTKCREYLDQVDIELMHAATLSSPFDLPTERI
jgi:hemerythrin-like domain-containing protein